jgi:hypothetical protein
MLGAMSTLRELRAHATHGGVFSTSLIHELLCAIVTAMCEHGVRGRAPPTRQFSHEFAAEVLSFVEDMLDNTAVLDRTLVAAAVKHTFNPKDEQDGPFRPEPLDLALQERRNRCEETLNAHQRRLVHYIDLMVECQHAGMVS